MKALIINAQRQAYQQQDILHTMTVGELRDYLADYDEDTPIILSHDDGYTYGGITERDLIEQYD